MSDYYSRGKLLANEESDFGADHEGCPVDDLLPSEETRMTDAQLDELPEDLNGAGERLRREPALHVLERALIATTCEQAATAIVALRERVAASEKDAERYRRLMNAAQSELAERDRRIAELEGDAERWRALIEFDGEYADGEHPPESKDMTADRWQALREYAENKHPASDVAMTAGEALDLLAARDVLASEVRALREALRKHVVAQYTLSAHGERERDEHCCDECARCWEVGNPEVHANGCLAKAERDR